MTGPLGPAVPRCHDLTSFGVDVQGLPAESARIPWTPSGGLPGQRLLKLHRRKPAVHVTTGTRNEAAGAARDQQERRPHQLARLAEPAQRRLAHYAGRALGGEDFAVLLRRKEAG